MRPPRPATTLAAGLALLVAAAPVPGEPGPGPAGEPGAPGAHQALAPALAALDVQSFDAPAWAAWRVSGPAGADVRVDLAGTVHNLSALWFTVWVLRADDLALVWFTFLGLTWTSGTFLHVEAEPAGVVLDVPAQSGPTSRDREFISTLPAAGTYFVVGMFSTDGSATGTAKLSGSAGVAVHGAAVGPSFMHRADDFSGALDVQQGYTLRVMRDTALPLEAGPGERMFGLFHARSNTGDLAMGYDGPLGSRDGRTFYALHGEPSGGYRFRVDRATDAVRLDHPLHHLIGIYGVPDLYLLGGAVALP